MPEPRGPTRVIGVGSPVMGDDGIGIHALERLRQEWALEGVELVDGGTWGMKLLPEIETAGRLMFLDAINTQRHAPGTVLVVEREQIPLLTDHNKLSPHQVDLREVLAVCEFRDTLPADTCAIGVVPDVVDLDVTMSDAARRGQDAMIAAVIARLEAWGHRCTRVGDGAVTEAYHASTDGRTAEPARAAALSGAAATPELAGA